MTPDQLAAEQQRQAARTAATALSIIAIAISFIPVLNFLSPILLGIAAGLTLVALACHIMLALSGDGSWVDVGLDLFALATFGYGRAAAAGLSATRAGLRTAARKALATAKKQTRRSAALAVDRLGRTHAPLLQRVMHLDGGLAAATGGRKAIVAHVTNLTAISDADRLAVKAAGTR